MNESINHLNLTAKCFNPGKIDLIGIILKLLLKFTLLMDFPLHSLLVKILDKSAPIPTLNLLSMNL